jgi:hypothetical protein
LRERPVDEVRLPPAPRFGPGGERGVALALRRRHASCLESALVRQAVLAARGSPRELVIGVARSADGVRAHAWLEGDPVDEAFTELARRGPA